MKEERRRRRRRRRRRKTILGFGRRIFYHRKISAEKSLCPPFLKRSDRRGTKKIFSKQTDLSLSASKY
jgi:hypothetical protein